MEYIVLNLLSKALIPIAWIVAVVFAWKMVKYTGARAERFLVAGASLMLVNSLLTSLSTYIKAWLQVWLVVEKGMGQLDLLPVFLGIDILNGCVAVVGIICLVYAFWVKFKKTQEQ